MTAIDRARRATRRLPAPLERRLLRLAGIPRVRRAVAPVRWGNLRRGQPFSRGHSDRGTPVDRVYIDRFVEAQAGAIHGHVLEVAEPTYAARFGDGDRVDVVDIDPANRAATFVVDLAERGSLPASTFDCCVVTQTLQYVSDVDAAVDNLWRSLAPGGSLIVTVPAVARSVHYVAAVDRWRMFPTGLDDVLRRGCPGGTVEVAGFGNLTTATAFLQGLAVEDLESADFAHDDPDFPLVSCGIARKAAV